MPLERFKLKEKDVVFKIGKDNVHAEELTDDQIQKLLETDASLSRFFEPIKEKKKAKPSEGKNESSGSAKKSESGTGGEETKSSTKS